ncbi:uncharacterized protein LOC106094538 isoform X1 [Stomoxys calcitrans]|uniref:uncharacterized protein LOC106094538 isoform X1 n=1 Tax=Stomoxys calcitrans TaxID=35570 RepID=UPI0027E36963|nr:uncharacterized protein LOC106094538 isoform X1 [Stomoxys calcitrans]
MDLYEEDEQIISSDDEYSEDDDDALMNDAIRAQQSYKARNVPSLSASCREKPNWCIDRKQKQLSSLIRRNKIFIIYKNKSIKWLNSKKQREKYKDQIIKNTNQDMGNNTKSSQLQIANDWKLGSTKSAVEKQNVVRLEEDENNYNNNRNGVKIDSSDLSIERKCPSNPNEEYSSSLMPPKKCLSISVTTQTQDILKGIKANCQSSQTETPKKRARSYSPIAFVNKEERENSEKRFKPESSQFYNRINELFPAFDGVAKNHIEHKTNNNLLATENEMKILLNEINALNDILHTKEVDWNRTLHLKIVKKEIYLRLMKKKNILEMNESLSKTCSQKSLLELKELDMYLSEKNSTTSTVNIPTIQQIIENRANMNTEDLEREKKNTSRLHSLLMSRNMLPDVESVENKVCTNGDVNINCNDVILKLNAYQRLKNLPLLDQEVANLRPKITNLTHDKNIIQQSKHMPFSNQDNFPTRENVKTTPTGIFKKKVIGQELPYTPGSLHDQYNVFVEESNIKRDGKRVAISSPKTIQYPYCQQCNIHESRFVCAGCGNQWYCSKECQISAWDKHSEICTE